MKQYTKELTTIKQVLTRIKYVVDNKDNYFLCCIPADLRAEGIISPSLADETKAYIISQRPTLELNTEFYNHPAYHNEIQFYNVWWSTAGTTYTVVIKEKIKFLKHIINKL